MQLLFFVQEGIVSGFLKTCHTCLHLDGNHAPGMLVVVIIIFLSRHALCRCNILDGAGGRLQV